MNQRETLIKAVDALLDYARALELYGATPPPDVRRDYEGLRRQAEVQPDIDLALQLLEVYVAMLQRITRSLREWKGVNGD